MWLSSVLFLWFLKIEGVPCDTGRDAEYANLLNSQNDVDFRRLQAEMMKRTMNGDANPCEDFYEYACGNWAHYGTESGSDSGVNEFLVLKEKLNFIYGALLGSEEEPTDYDAEIKAKVIFNTCMSSGLNHSEQFQAYLESFASWSALNRSWTEGDFSWVSLTAKSLLHNVSVFFDVKHMYDPKEFGADVSAPYTRVFLADVPKYVKDGVLNSFNKYFYYMNRILTVFLVDPNYIVPMSTRLYQFEKRFVNILKKLDNSASPPRLVSLGAAPRIFNVTQFVSVLAGRHMSLQEMVQIEMPHLVEEVLQLIEQSSSRTVADYIFWRFVEHFSIVLSILREDTTRRRRFCVSIIKEKMASALTSIFAKKYFHETDKEQVLHLIRDLQVSGLEMISKSGWIDHPTKVKAVDKLRIFSSFIGYPEYILFDDELRKEYDFLDVDHYNFIKNFVALNVFKTRKQFDIFGQRYELQWQVDSFDPNAFFDNTTLMFTLSVLQPPFYHRHSPQFVNFGGLGATIGHEILHGFDLWNIQDDSEGNEQRWWSPSIEASYSDRMSCFVNQYSQFEIPNTNLSVDGLQTLSENLADGEGLNMAFLAYTNWLNRSNHPERLELEGFSSLNLNPKQLFFVSYAQTFCANNTNRSLDKIVSSFHALEYFRTIGSVSNSPDFGETFSCPVGSKMNPAKKCRYV